VCDVIETTKKFEAFKKERMPKETDLNGMRRFETYKEISKPYTYSLDMFWKMQMERLVYQSIEYGNEDTYSKLLSKIEKRTNLPDILYRWQKWTDPFTENPNETEIARTSQELLDGLAETHAILNDPTRVGSDVPSLRVGQFAEMTVEIARRAEERLKAVADHRPPEAHSLTHMMYLELVDRLQDRRVRTREQCRKDAKNSNISEEDATDEWDAKYEQIRDLYDSAGQKDPYAFWVNKLDGVTTICSTHDRLQHVPEELRKVLKLHDFAADIKNWQTVVYDMQAPDYVRRVREAAWAINDTVSAFLRGIFDNWPEARKDASVRLLRNELTTTLSVIAAAVHKQVSYLTIVLSRT
jgi:hypothetical protein